MLQMLSLPKVGKVIGGIERFILQSSAINDIVFIGATDALSAAQRQAVSYTTLKGVKRMRLTITLTLRKLMLQFIIKSRNRHSGK